LDHTAQKWTDLILQTKWSLKQDDGKLQWLTLNQGGDHTQVKGFAVKANLTTLDNQQLVDITCNRTK
jgi:hypothetical protein